MCADEDESVDSAHVNHFLRHDHHDDLVGNSELTDTGSADRVELPLDVADELAADEDEGTQSGLSDHKAKTNCDVLHVAQDSNQHQILMLGIYWGSCSRCAQSEPSVFAMGLTSCSLYQ